MSEVLGKFIEPYVHLTHTTRDYRDLLTMAIFAWNLTLMPEREKATCFKEALSEMPKKLAVKSRPLLEDMLERKIEHFSRYKRWIVNFKVRRVKDQYHLTVLSTVNPCRSDDNTGKDRLIGT